MPFQYKAVIVNQQEDLCCFVTCLFLVVVVVVVQLLGAFAQFAISDYYISQSYRASDIIKDFYLPTDVQENCFKRSIKSK